MEFDISGEQVELEEYSIYSVYSTSESGTAGIVVIDLDGLWAFLPEYNDICYI